jgi:hypothetical protein
MARGPSPLYGAAIRQPSKSTGSSPVGTLAAPPPATTIRRSSGPRSSSLPSEGSTSECTTAVSTADCTT